MRSRAVPSGESARTASCEAPAMRLYASTINASFEGKWLYRVRSATSAVSATACIVKLIAPTSASTSAVASSTRRRVVALTCERLSMEYWRGMRFLLYMHAGVH
jgi:hypothetical protein